MPCSRHNLDSRSTFGKCAPLPLPILTLTSSWKESHDTARTSIYFPKAERKLFLTWLPLVTIETDSKRRSFLQYSSSCPRYFGYRKGSPPAKFIFLIPASFSRRRPFFALSSGSTYEVFAVWKQKPHS